MQFDAQIPLSSFGIQAPVSVPGFSLGHAHQDFVPKVSGSYKFRRDLLRSVLSWLNEPMDDSLFLVGPTGSGKTSLILEAAGRLNWPALQTNAHSRLEWPELVGHHSITVDPPTGDQKMIFVDGPLTMAVERGYIFILDEMDFLNPDTASALNAVLEGRPLVIAEDGGRIIHPHPNFRFVGTANTAGQGDETGLYGGTQQQNLATMDRYRTLRVSYMDPDDEVGMLQAALPGVDASVLQPFVKIANKIRAQFIGCDQEERNRIVANANPGSTGSATADERGQLTVTMSTRTLVRWAKLQAGLAKTPCQSPLYVSMRQALTNRADFLQRTAIHKICEEVFGDQLWKETEA